MRVFSFLLLLLGSLGPAPLLHSQAASSQAFTQAPRLQNAEELQQLLTAGYPDHLRKLGIGGRIQLRLDIDAAGAVTHSEIQRTSGFISLDSAALRLVPRLRFEPARNGAAAVPLTIVFPLGFSPAVPAEHRPQEAARGPSVLNEGDLKHRLRRLCGRNSLVAQTSVKLLIGADGRVRSLEFLEPSGWRGLDRMAIEIITNARFAPASTSSGMPVGSWLVYTFSCIY